MHKFLRTTILITSGLLILCIASGCGDNRMDPAQSEDDVGSASATEVVMDLPQQKDDVSLPPTITVMVDPPPGSDIDVDRTEFTLWFSQEVVAVTVNGATATGSGQNWSVWSYNLSLEWQAGQVLEIEWKTRDGSTGSQSVGPYTVWVVHIVPPEIIGGTVSDGDVDVDPRSISAGGLRFDFDRPVTGTIKLTDEAGVDLNWIATVAGQTATLTAVAGQEMVNETTYKIEIDVADGADLPLQTTITFVTKLK